jgi:O-antigen ligase
MERLTFNTRTMRRDGSLVLAGQPAGSRVPAPAAFARVAAHGHTARERYDWDYLWMLAFTALLFFRPQDQIPGLESLHLAELTAIAGLAAMAVRRTGAGLTITKVNPEVIAVLALGAVIVLTMPFSIWPSGSLKVFSDIFVKIILIFALMMSTLASPKRVRQMTWIMIAASGYIAGRAVFDYARGVNLVEGDRVRGALGGIFRNPNDLALNLVTFLAPTLFFVIQERRASRRLLAGGFAVLMLGAIVCTKSRSGFLGLLAMGAVVLYYTVRVKPGVIVGVVLGSLLALPLMPQSFWDRMDSITNAQEDKTGSREARLNLMTQALEVFAQNPITGVGAGQFQNYQETGVTVEKWRVTHNVWLQVATELGIFGVAVFAFMVIRAYGSCFAALRALKQPAKRRRAPHWAQRATAARAAPPPAASTLGDEGRRILETNAKGMLAALVGWTVCSFFASVAFNWTFYYVFALAVAGREIAVAHRAAPAEVPEVAAAPRLVRAHA